MLLCTRTFDMDVLELEHYAQLLQTGHRYAELCLSYKFILAGCWHTRGAVHRV